MSIPEPKWLSIARSKIGVREIRGPQHSPGVMGMVQRASGWLGIRVTDDETPWCGTFVAACFADAGYKPPRGFIGVRAKAWATWGMPCPMPATRPSLGSVAVFGRDGGGHVGFVVGVHSNGDLDILGGNQGDAVNIRRFPRSRLLALRWPLGAAMGEPVTWASARTQQTTGEA